MKKRKKRETPGRLFLRGSGLIPEGESKVLCSRKIKNLETEGRRFFLELYNFFAQTNEK